MQALSYVPSKEDRQRKKGTIKRRKRKKQEKKRKEKKDKKGVRKKEKMKAGKMKERKKEKEGKGIKKEGMSVVNSSVGRALSFSHEGPRFKSQRGHLFASLLIWDLIDC
jgi:hypothetical protein